MNASLFKLLLSAALLAISNCFVFSSFQSAKLLSKNQFEAEPIVSATSKLFNNVVYHSGNTMVGFQTGYGISDRFNIRGRIIHIAEMGGSDANYFEVEPKVSIKKNRVSFSLPIGYYSTESIQAMPSFIFSTPIGKNALLNTSPRIPLAVTFKNGSIEPDFAGLSLDEGVSFFLSNNRIVITPEIGITTFTFSDCMLHFGLGLSLIR